MPSSDQPPIRRFIHGAGVAAEAPALPERQLVHPVGAERMRHAADGAGIANPLTRIAQRVALRPVLPPVDVVALELQPLRQPLVELELQRVVVGRAAVADDVGAANQVGVGLEEVRRQSGRERVVAERGIADQPIVAGVGEVVRLRIELGEVAEERRVRPVRAAVARRVAGMRTRAGR